jgi:hypothetical protein
MQHSVNLQHLPEEPVFELKKALSFPQGYTISTILHPEKNPPTSAQLILQVKIPYLLTFHSLAFVEYHRIAGQFFFLFEYYLIYIDYLLRLIIQLQPESYEPYLPLIVSVRNDFYWMVSYITSLTVWSS